jgi:hypothetical protein
MEKDSQRSTIDGRTTKSISKRQLREIAVSILRNVGVALSIATKVLAATYPLLWRVSYRGGRLSGEGQCGLYRVGEAGEAPAEPRPSSAGAAFSHWNPWQVVIRLPLGFLPRGSAGSHQGRSEGLNVSQLMRSRVFRRYNRCDCDRWIARVFKRSILLPWTSISWDSLFEFVLYE